MQFIERVEHPRELNLVPHPADERAYRPFVRPGKMTLLGRFTRRVETILVLNTPKILVFQKVALHSNIANRHDQATTVHMKEYQKRPHGL